jgi:hypothetical protein
MDSSRYNQESRRRVPNVPVRNCTLARADIACGRLFSSLLSVAGRTPLIKHSNQH